MTSREKWEIAEAKTPKPTTDNVADRWLYFNDFWRYAQDDIVEKKIKETNWKRILMWALIIVLVLVVGVVGVKLALKEKKQVIAIKENAA